jgi:hypothetical protein
MEKGKVLKIAGIEYTVRGACNNGKRVKLATKDQWRNFKKVKIASLVDLGPDGFEIRKGIPETTEISTAV